MGTGPAFLLSGSNEDTIGRKFHEIRAYAFSGITLMGYLKSHDLDFCQLVQF